MARQVISTTPHFSGLGNKAFESFEKVNDNFLELYTGANIPVLAPASALTGTELFPAVQGGTFVKATLPLTDRTAATYAIARTLVGTNTGDRLQVLGRTTQSDGGQGLFTWVAGGSTSINDGIELTATGGIWKRTPDQETNPFMFGAKGDSVTDDTAAVQAAANTGYCLLPALAIGKSFKVIFPIQVLDSGVFIGQGQHSVLYASAVTGGVVQIGVGSGGLIPRNAIVGNFRIIGTATKGVKVSYATNIYLDKIWCSSLAGDPGGTPPTFIDAFDFDVSFNSTFTNLNTTNSVTGGTATFTGSVGGATSGTLNASFASGIYEFVFSNGERRLVTISAGTAASWSTALAAGTVTTAWYGSCFRIGGAFNANYCSNWIATTSAAAYNIYIGDDLNSGPTSGTTFDALSCTGGVVGLCIVDGQMHTFNSLYTENCAMPLVLGRPVVYSGLFPSNLTFNSPILSGPAPSHPAYALRVAQVMLNECSGITFNSPNLSAFGLATIAPLTFTLGGAATQAQGYGLVNAAGIVKAVVVTYPGSGYSGNPTVTVGGSGSGAVVTAVQAGGIITTANLTLSNGGSGYSGSPPMPVWYNNANEILINSPYSQNSTLGLWPFIVRGPNAGGSGVMIINDNATTYSGTNYTNGNLARTAGASNEHWLSYLTGTGPQGTPPVTNWVLVKPPLFP